MEQRFQPNINTQTGYHVFIGTDFSRDTCAAYDVTKYSIESQSSVDLSIIPIKPSDKLLIPTLCLKHKLKGKAFYVEEGCLFKADILQLFDIVDSSAMLWCVKHKKDYVLWQKFMGFNLGIPSLYSLLPPNADKWKEFYTSKLWYISRKSYVAENEIGNIPKEWRVIPDLFDKVEYTKIKCIDFSLNPPWVNRFVKFYKDWFKEYQLFLSNVLLKELKNLTA